jgi:hypothetical protein
MRVLRRRYQNALYWSPGGIDADGNRVYGTVVELKDDRAVRWEDINEAVTTRSGETIVSRSKVYAGEDLEEEGVLWLGSLADAVSTTQPFANPGAFEIRKFSKIPNLRATEFLRVAWL